MAIEEAIEIIKGTQPFTFGRGKFADAIETLVIFAEWYKDQDLISRDVALSKTEDVYFAACAESEKLWKCYLYDNCGECKTHQVELEIAQIPKAEYRGNEDEERSNNL